MATLQPAKYGKVIGRLLAVVADGPDEDEYPNSGGFPDAVPVQGSVTFTPRATQILVPLANPVPVTAFPTPITVQLDQNGFLTHNGKKGVFLLCPSPQTNPPEFTYSVSYNLSLDGAVVSSAKFDLELVEYVPGPNPADPDAGSTAVDLTLVTPVYPTPGTPVVRGPKGDSWLDVRLSNDGLALVFQLQTETAVVDDVVTLPALADLAAAVGASEDARDEAGGFATLASGHASDAEDFKDAAGGSAGAAALSASAAHDSELAALGHEEQAEHWAEVASEAVSSGVPDATASAKGKLKLAGDLGGTADEPTVPGLANKADSSTVVSLSGNQTINGTKNFAGGLQASGKSVVVTDDGRLSDARDPKTGSVVTASIGANAVTEPKLATDSVTSRQIAADAVGSSELANDAVDTAAVQNGAITNAKLAALSIPYDITFVAQSSNRTTGLGDVPAGIKLRRAVTFSEVLFHCETADASGNLVVEIRKNGIAVSGTSTTIASANQVAGGTSTGAWAFAAGDFLTINVTAVGTTPGKGLTAELKGLA